MEKEKIFELLNNNLVFNLATVEGNIPHVRGMLLYKADETGIVFHTGANKDVCRQMIENPNVELCFYDIISNIQIRIRGTVEVVDDNNLKEEISVHPTREFLKPLKASFPDVQDFYKFITVFRLKNGKANVWTL